MAELNEENKQIIERFCSFFRRNSS